MHREEKLKFLLEAHRSLREEILEAVRLQNKIIMGEAIAVGIILGLGLGGEEIFKVLIGANPPIIVVLTSLWIVEQSRMMRAGNYLQFLEDKINYEMGTVCISWENWLRREEKRLRPEERREENWLRRKVGQLFDRLSIHKIHHYAQYIGCVSLFYGIGIISLYLFYEYLEVLSYWATAFIGLHAFLLIILFPFILKIITHRGKKEDKQKFKEWEDKYWRDIVKIYKRRDSDENTNG